MRDQISNQGASAHGESASDFEERYRAFIQNSTEGIWRCDTDEPIDTSLPESAQVDAFFQVGYLAEVNDAFARMYGFEKGDELVGVRLNALLVRDDPQNIDYLTAFVRSGYRLSDAESVESDRDGSVRIFSNSLTGILQDGKLHRAWGTQRDITDQKRLEEALRASEERFRAMFEQAAFPILVVSLEGITLMANQATADFFGTTTDALLTPVASGGQDSDGFPFLSDMLPSRLLSEVAGGDHRTVRHRYTRSDGWECWSLTTVSVLQSEQGKPTSFLATLTDVTPQTLAERRREEAILALRESEERLRLALASGEMGTWDADLVSGHLTLSEEIPPLCGRSGRRVTLHIREWLEWLHPGDRDRVSGAFSAALRGESDYSVEFRTLWPDEKTFRWIATRALITRDSEGTPVRAVGYTRNVTREKEQEAEREAMLTRQRQFMREFVFSLTEGKFRMCLSELDLPVSLPANSDILPLTISTLRALRLRLNDVTKELDFPLERSQDIETAVGEAAMNAATHGGGGEGWICSDPHTGIVQIWIRDRGTGIPEESLPKVLRKGVSLAGTLGHGFWLMLGTCDRVALLSTSSGTTIVLEQERVVPEPIWLQNVARPGFSPGAASGQR